MEEKTEGAGEQGEDTDQAQSRLQLLVGRTTHLPPKLLKNFSSEKKKEKKKEGLGGMQSTCYQQR